MAAEGRPLQTLSSDAEGPLRPGAIARSMARIWDEDRTPQGSSYEGQSAEEAVLRRVGGLSSSSKRVGPSSSRPRSERHRDKENTRGENDRQRSSREASHGSSRHRHTESSSRNDRLVDELDNEVHAPLPLARGLRCYCRTWRAD